MKPVTMRIVNVIVIFIFIVDYCYRFALQVNIFEFVCLIFGGV